MIGKIFHALGTFLSDCAEILQSPYSHNKKIRLLGAYIKISFIHYTVAKVISVKRVHFLGFFVETFTFYNFYFLFREIFVKHSYYSRADAPTIILDCGANIGMATLYFHWLWPNAAIACYEPDTVTFEVLKRNIENNSLKNVTLHNVAVSDGDGELTFYAAHDNPGCLKMSTRKERMVGDAYTVPCIDFSDAMKDPISILKMDIEGAEYSVITHAAETGVLSNAQEIFVEYHHNIPNESSHAFSSFLSLFESLGYMYQLEANTNGWGHTDRSQDVLVHLRKKSI